jgi:PAS domain S-box-containing protein
MNRVAATGSYGDSGDADAPEALIRDPANRAGAEPAEAGPLRARQILSLARQTPMVAAGNLVNSLLTAFVFWDVGPRSFLAAWLAVVWLLALLHLRGWSRNRNRAMPEALGSKVTRKAASLFALPTACIGFVLTCMPPLIGRLAAQGDDMHLMMAAMVTIYTASLLFFVRNGYAGFVEHFRTDQENRGLLDRLLSASAELEQRVEARTAELAAKNERLGNEIAERKRAEAELGTAQTRLVDAIESASDGFALYDADDRLVVCNSKYREIYAISADLIVPGVSFEDILRKGVERRQYASAVGREEEWIRERLAQHRNPDGPIEQRLPDGRWLRIAEYKTRDGGTVGFRSDITTLKRREMRFHSIAEFGAIPMSIVSLSEGTILYVNSCMTKLYELPPEEIIGRSVFDFYEDPADRERLIEPLLSHGHVDDFEVRLKKPDGTTFWALLSARRFQFENVEAVASAFSDITDRKRAEEELRLSEQRAQGIMDNLAEGVITMDRQGRIESFNPAAEGLFGYGADEVLGRNIKMLMPEPVRSQHDGYLRDYARTDKGKFIGAGPRTVDGRHKDGARVPIELSVGDLVLDDSHHFVGALRDVTHRKEAAAQLRARAFQQELIAALGQRALEIDDTRILTEEVVIVLVAMLSVKFCEVLELQPDGKTLVRRTGLGWRDDLPGSGTLCADPGSQARHTLGSSEPVVIEDLSAETRFEVPGSLIEQGAVSGVTVVVPGQPRPYGIISAYTSEPRTFTNDDLHFLQSLANWLAALIGRNEAEQGRKQVESQLRQGQKMESLGTLAGGIAHDVNNVLVPILGLTKLVMKRLPEGSRERTNLEKVLEAGGRAKQLVKQILTFSREEQPEREAVELGTIAEEALRLLRSTLPSTIEIRQEIEPNSGMVYANSTQIHQVLVNLGSNAAHAMGTGNGRLKVTVKNIELGGLDGAKGLGLEPGQYAKLSVSDTGCGIDEKTLERIFEPFFTTKDVGEGTGMGLSVVHGIVNNHGGTITATSSLGHGTTFDVFLPLCGGPESAVPSGEGADEAAKQITSPATGAGAGDMAPIGPPAATEPQTEPTPPLTV